MMASNGNREKIVSISKEEIPLQNVKYVYEEDEYGYVKTNEEKISKALISQLPSRQFDLIDLGSNVDISHRSLRRRQSQYRTLQLKTATLNSHQVSPDVDKIYEILNLDPEVKEEDKIKTLRDMHQSLYIKRQVKEKLDADLKRKRADQALDRFTRMKLHTHSLWYRFLYYLKSLMYCLEPWHSNIKTIQGQFGSCVASYFIFLRWLLYLNLCNFFVFLFFLFIPQLAYEYSNQFKALNSTNEDFSGFDFLTGSGWFTDSALYFGHYSSEVIELVAGLRYNMPLAYLMTVGANSIINLVAVSFSLTSSYQKNYVDTAGDLKHLFCNKIFSAWDYSIETEDAAKLRKIAFCNEIKELLSFMRTKHEKKTLKEKIVVGGLMIIINICCLAIAILISYGVYFLLEKKALKVDVRILEDMTLSLTVTFVSSTCYFLFKYVTKLEYYLKKKTKLYLTMIRVVVLRSTMIGMIVYFWMIAVAPGRKCDETELGKEVYRLILVNFLIALIFFTFFGEFIRKLCRKFILTSIKLSEFDVAFNTLDLIYYQTLIWIGTFCMPVAPLIFIIILILLFYIKMDSISSNCRPPKRTWSVNEAQTFFLTLLFLIYLLSAFTVGYVIFALPQSNYCGPFQGYESTAELIHAVFFDKGKEHKANELLKYLSSPGVLFAFFCALCVVVYYARAQAMAHVAVVKLIREQLIMEGKDKVFLLKLFDDALVAHSQKSQNGSDKNGKKKDPPTPQSDPSEATNQEMLFNENYAEYIEAPVTSPLPRNLQPGYMPANVPINKSSIGSEQGAIHTPQMGEHKFRSPLNSSIGSDTPTRRAKGIHVPSHQPGFRHVLGEDSPRANSEEFRVYP